MAAWTNYWRIVTPATRKASYNQAPVRQDDQGQSPGFASFATVSWFTNVMKGAASRLQKYKQYDNMDAGDVSRALDTIAEEISNADKRTNLPFIIDYQTEENQNISDTTATTLRAALRHWSNFHGLNKKVYNIARSMCKYGDCFFRKTSDTKPWEYVNATRVVGIEIDPFTGEKIAYHIRPAQIEGQGQTESVEIVPAAAMLHFTLSDEMDDTAPFGRSILQPAYLDWQKLQMLESAAIIYRIVRAPERRVFYIDVGNMPPQRVKQYIESIKNDIRQKRIPSQNSGQNTDSQYNPESIQEDMFFPVTAAGRGSRVETLPGGQTWDIPELDYFLKRLFRALRVPTSYMAGQDAQGAQFSDGKVGIAYIEELRFANFIMRLQTSLEEVFDREFKTYLQVVGINLDSEIFRLSLPEPQNFALYRQAALDTDLINSFKSIEDTEYLSKRFILKRYLGLTEDEIQMNEAMLKQERSIENRPEVGELQQMYDPAVYGNREKVEVDGDAAMDDGGMGMGGDMGGGMDNSETFGAAAEAGDETTDDTATDDTTDTGTATASTAA
jgi:hypothetical protein